MLASRPAEWSCSRSRVGSVNGAAKRGPLRLVESSPPQQTRLLQALARTRQRPARRPPQPLVMRQQWIAGHDDLTQGALWHGDGLEMLRAVASTTPIQLILSSPPYNVAKPYETPMEFDEYVEWQSRVLATCVPLVAPGGSVVWQVGTWVDRRRGAVYPIDAMLFPVLCRLGLTPRNRAIWTVSHGLHAKHRLSGRHETVLWFTKDRPDGSYDFDLDAIRVPQLHPQKRRYKGPRKGELSCNPAGKNPGDVWDFGQVKHGHPEKTGHPCQMPLALAERAVRMTTRENDVVLDPFAGSCTSVVAARLHGRRAAGADLDASYLRLGEERLRQLSEGRLPRHVPKPASTSGYSSHSNHAV